MVDNVKETTWARHVDMDKAQAYGQKVAGYLPRHRRENGFEEIAQEEALQAAQYAARDRLGARRTRPPTRPWRPWCTT